MEAFIAIPLVIIGSVFGLWLAIKLIGVIGTVAIHIFRFIGGEITDLLRIVGSIITGLVFVPLVLFSVLIGRWSASAHYGRALQAETKAAGLAAYRCLVGHPLRLVGAQALLEGIEQRVPEAMAGAPTRDKPTKRSGKFDGYMIVGSLAGGGSGGKLYVAEPDAIKRASFERSGAGEVDQVVIKSFSLQDGSSLPQIVRESRSLDAAKKLGLVLDHQLDGERFFYVMRYVPGESLGVVTQRLHAESPSEGLDTRRLRSALGFVTDLARTLDAYHRGGLWHKDVKPDNIIVDTTGAHLVDFGLVTPLRSAMTLTTHGTEYFRDPEMVKMALRGVKVHEVDGAKFDIYAAGAVLYSVVENSFPAHGALSQLTRRCPDAVKWIIRRAMTDYDKRYGSSAAMLADLEHVLRAEDPFKVKPASLPSMTGGGPDAAQEAESAAQAAAFDAAAGFGPRPGGGVRGGGRLREVGERVLRDLEKGGVVIGASLGSPRPVGQKKKPGIRVTDWWTGSFVVDGAAPMRANRTNPRQHRAGRGVKAPGDRLPASEQLRRARERVQAARTRAQSRRGKPHRRQKDERFNNDVNVGVAASVLIAAVLGFFVAREMVFKRQYVSAPTTVLAGADDDGILTAFDADSDAKSTAAASSPESVLASLPAAWKEDLRGSALVVSDFQPPLDDAIAASISSAADQLSQLGITLLGTSGDNADPEHASWEKELLAEVRRVRGLSPIGSPDMREHVETWISETDGVDFVVWLAPADNTPGQPAVWVFGPPGMGLVTSGG